MPNINNVYDIVVIISSGEVLSISHDEMSGQLFSLFNQIEILKPTVNISKNTQN